MPNIGAHMVVAKLISKLLNLDSDDFIRGNLLPDVIDVKNSHHKIVDGIYMVPDIEYFSKKLDLTKDLQVGYLAHLLLDKHFLNDYIKKLYPNENIFKDGYVYKDYDIVNARLVSKFKLDIEKIEDILSKYDCKILEEKLKYNIECLKQKTTGATKYLDFESFSVFLIDTSYVISEELIKYANKYRKLYIRTRQWKEQ